MDLFLNTSAYVIRFLYIINSESLRLCAFILNIWNITVYINIISILFSFSLRGSLRAFLSSVAVLVVTVEREMFKADRPFEVRRMGVDVLGPV